MELLTVSGLRKQYGSHAAVNGLDFQIQTGRCVALLGPNGAGKTTTLRMLAGLLKPSSGQISWNEQVGHVRDPRQIIGYLPQMPVFYPWMSGQEFLNYVGQLANLSAKEAESRTADVLVQVGLKDAAKRKIGGYSGGMKQRLGLAQALVHRPKLLMMDEPVSALDPIGRREVLDLIQAIRQETTILFSTHVLHDAEEVCDDVLIMNKGQIAIKGDLNTVRKEYQSPVIRIQVEPFDGDKAWLANLKNRPYVDEVTIELHTAYLTTKNIDEARYELMKELVEGHIPIVKLEIEQTTLEDLFMRVVSR
ncbi:ABC transporter ATP-binding protein [Paenibacillus albiflavus]|uniref:ABC transporter ATP-binding protein n=1 Tax=Paenibacillus albiflavus TaxID=2545760 RepID=A0A4R4EGN0_9BACL|nr:ABC transporter ATP-binding protein [Paenibacillus albiflavus]TCZ78767.1 ABC transporter ATP-binding protein [Paenibacillus albiflavus]